MWMAVVLAIGALTAEGETTEITTLKTLQDSNAYFEVTGWVERETITNGARKGVYWEWAHLSVLRLADDKVWESPLQSTSGIEFVKLTGDDEFVTVERIIQNRGHRIIRYGVSESGSPEETEVCYAYWPYLAPNEKWVFYKHWYPRMGTPDEYQHTSTWMVDITQPAFRPVLVYPPDNKTGAEPDGRIHSALTGGPAPLWSADSRKLYYFDKLSQEHNWKGAVVSLVEIQIGEDMSIEKTTAFPVNVEDFAKPGVDLAKLAFYPKELHWAGEGVIGGTLDSDRGWAIEAFCMSTTGEYVEASIAED